MSAAAALPASAISASAEKKSSLIGAPIPEDAARSAHLDYTNWTSARRDCQARGHDLGRTCSFPATLAAAGCVTKSLHSPRAAAGFCNVVTVMLLHPARGSEFLRHAGVITAAR